MADARVTFDRWDEGEVGAQFAALVSYAAAQTRGHVDIAIGTALTREGRWDVEVWTWSEEEADDLRFYTETLLVDAGPVDEEPWSPHVYWHPFGTRRDQ